MSISGKMLHVDANSNKRYHDAKGASSLTQFSYTCSTILDACTPQCSLVELMASLNIHSFLLASG
jgi:hypothetical protein